MTSKKIQIVADSAADLPKDIVEEYGITVVPLSVSHEGETFQDGDLTLSELLERMHRSRHLPQTSQPAPGEFLEVFNHLADAGPILCLTISEKLSGTIQSARLAATMTEADVDVFDTEVATLAEGAQVIRAAQLAREDRTRDEIIAYLEEYRKSQRAYPAFISLTNLVKGGRLPQWKGRIAEFFNVRVLGENRDGAIEVLEKVRGTDQLFARLMERFRQEAVDVEDRIIGISHADNLKWARWLAEQVAPFNPRDIVIGEMGAVIATHAGPGSVVLGV